MAKLSPQDFTLIKDVVGEVEKSTSAEIVPLVLAHSGDYRWVHTAMSFQGLLFGMMVGLGIESFAPHSFGFETYTVSEDRWLILAGGALGFLASLVPSLSRMFLGQDRLHAEVDKRSHAEFVRQGCAETTGRTGVLVLVSLFEREIQIVADRGIQEKMVALEGPAIWDTLCGEFIVFAKEGKAIEGLAHVIRRLGTVLAKHFPDNGLGSPGLSNELRTDKS